MKLLTVYNDIKQKVKTLYHQLNTKNKKQATGRPRALSTIEVLTLAIYKQTQGIVTKKAIWKDFGLTCSYKTFVVSFNKFFPLALLFLLYLLRLNQQHAHPVKHTDSTDIPVCLNKNAKHHKTMAPLAEWGHSGKGLFYGIKLHLTSDLNRNILSFSFAPGNKDDRSQFMKVNKHLEGIFVADAGYCSQKLEKEFYQENKRILFAKPKRNMKKIASLIQTKLYDTRMLIELNFRSLKMFFTLVTSLPRSIDGYLANYVYSLLGYVLA